MSRLIEQYKKTLKERGYSLTRPRESVFLALQNQEPLTIRQLIAACPGINRASVYRSLTVLERIGVIQRVQLGWKYKIELSESYSRHHHHLTCLNCHQVIEFDEDEDLQNRLNDIALGKLFVMQDHQLEIQGMCQNCSTAKHKTRDEMRPGR